MKTPLFLAVVVCLIPGLPIADVPQSGAAIYKPGDGVQAPVLLKQVKPAYPAAAIDARLEGAVTLECVVLVDGSVGEVSVTKSLDSALDEEAIKAVKQWRFTPGTKDGKPVQVRVTVAINFALTSKPGQSLFPVVVVAVTPPPVSVGAEPGTVFRPGNGVHAPVLLKDAKPSYTPEAKRARIEGTVLLDCVVLTDGSVGDVTVTKSVDAGLDEEAIKALRLWSFSPGIRDGKPVPVRVSIEMKFTLR